MATMAPEQSCAHGHSEKYPFEIDCNGKYHLFGKASWETQKNETASRLRVRPSRVRRKEIWEEKKKLREMLTLEQKMERKKEIKKASNKRKKERRNGRKLPVAQRLPVGKLPVASSQGSSIRELLHAPDEMRETQAEEARVSKKEVYIVGKLPVASSQGSSIRELLRARDELREKQRWRKEKYLKEKGVHLLAEMGEMQREMQRVEEKIPVTIRDKGDLNSNNGRFSIKYDVQGYEDMKAVIETTFAFIDDVCFGYLDDDPEVWTTTFAVRCKCGANTGVWSEAHWTWFCKRCGANYINHIYKMWNKQSKMWNKKKKRKKMNDARNKAKKRLREEDPGVYVTPEGELVPINVQERRAEARRHAGKSIWYMSNDQPYGLADWRQPCRAGSRQPPPDPRIRRPLPVT